MNYCTVAMTDAQIHGFQTQKLLTLNSNVKQHFKSWWFFLEEKVCVFEQMVYIYSEYRGKNVTPSSLLCWYYPICATDSSYLREKPRKVTSAGSVRLVLGTVCIAWLWFVTIEPLRFRVSIPNRRASSSCSESTIL